MKTLSMRNFIQTRPLFPRPSSRRTAPLSTSPLICRNPAYSLRTHKLSSQIRNTLSACSWRYPSVQHRTLITSPQQPSPETRTESFPDPDRPDLFYHLFYPPTSFSSSTPLYALSFLPSAPKSIASKTVIGWLPASAEGEEDGAGLNDFRENPAFRELLHEALHSGIRDGVDEVQKNGAIQTHQGWMHINDERNIPALGRIGDPDDILASVRVEEGRILPDTYQPMPSYRLCTSDGLLKLSEGLATRLRERLEKEAGREGAV